MSRGHEPTRGEAALRVGEETPRLAREFKGVSSGETIRRCIEVSERRSEDAEIAICLPALVRRHAREMPRATGPRRDS